MRRYLTYAGYTFLLVTLCSCTPEEDPFINTDEERAAAIRAATPTELPPVTTVGAGTMGAYIIPTPGSELHRLAGEDTILFVASGVERGGSIGTISTSCRPFQNWRFESTGQISILGNWCPRPEIDIEHSQVLIFNLLNDSEGGVFGSIFYAYSATGSSLDEIKFRNDSVPITRINLLRNDQSSAILSVRFSESAFALDSSDSVKIEMARLDATYGSTP